jgi:outer membrane scaffolding protein for murein synthesis (MipA/OmpV family)
LYFCLSGEEFGGKNSAARAAIGRRISKVRRSRSVWLAVCAGLLSARPCPAETMPLWELGLGPGAVRFSDFPGSGSYRNYLVPVPYIRYRGKILRSDRDGMRGIVLDKPGASLNISLWAAVPARGERNSARAGMPNLSALVEVGPSLDLHLWRSRTNKMQLDLRLPARVALTVASPPRDVGWVAAPHVNLDIRNLGGTPGWNFGMLAGPLFATQRYNRYYYAVSPAYATAQRPAYDPPAGYAGTEFTMALSKRFRTIWVGGFLRYESLSGAVFSNSPLIRSRFDVAGGVGIAWIIWHSDRGVEEAGE